MLQSALEYLDVYPGLPRPPWDGLEQGYPYVSISYRVAGTRPEQWDRA